MRNKFLTLAIVGPAVLLAGCSNFEPAPIFSDLSNKKIISNTASLTHTIVRDSKTPLHTCSLPPPDAAFSDASEGDINISLVSVGSSKGDASSENTAAEEVEMAGRTPGVLITRELFFRLCEFTHNHGLDKKEAIDLYKQTLTTVQGVWTIEAGKTTVTIGDTVATTSATSVTDTTADTLSQTGTTSQTDSETGTTSDTTSSTGSTTTSQ